ncbi:MAG: cob(I)yrinic acid a,c-diamide adenosyltransferase [Candidatus Diapherotrites archaeon]
MVEKSFSGKLERGLIHVYTGDGKGKTTASLGLALRAMGHGLNVYMVQFMKIGYTGELLALQKFGLPMGFESYNVECKNQSLHDAEIAAGTFKGYCRDCFIPTQYDALMAVKAFAKGKDAVLSGKYDMVIFDELNVALNMKLVPLEEVLSLMKEKPPFMEMIITGRNAPQEVLNEADYITLMDLKRHPYMKKIYARKGIEF